MNAEEILARLQGVRRNGKGWMARCPAHADKNPSLSVDVREGKVLVHCHAGCSQEAVCTALGAEAPELFDAGAGESEKRIVAEYAYTDEEGKLLYIVERREPKDFRQRRPNGNGGWTWNLDNTRRVVYRLPEVLTAKSLLICEGEKDCDTARAFGLVATCNPGGAGKWREEYSELLGGKQITIIADADEPGRKHAQQVAASLSGKAGSVKVLEFLHAKDLSEWVAKGGTHDALLKLVHDTPEWKETAVAVSQQSQFGSILSDDKDFELTELGNAERLVARFGEDIRYNHEQRKWLEWTGKVWTRDRTGSVRKRIEEIVKDILSEAANARGERQEALARWGIQSQKDVVARGTLSWATSKVPVLTDQFDQDIYLLNLNNGTLDLRTGEFRSHQREDFITKIIQVDYDADAKCPRWEQFLSEVIKDRATIEFLQRAVGYSLTGFAGEHCLFLLHGTGRNGKSVFIKTIQHILGGYAMQTDWQSFTVNKHGGVQIRNDIARLHGARLVAAIESEQSLRIAESLIKAVTGGDRITARFLYQESFEFIPQFKLWLATNHKPKIVGIDDAIWSRIKLIPFTVTISPEKRDVYLSEKLQEEACGVLNWALEGLRTYNANGLQEPHTVAGATADYRQTSDVLKHFLDSQCIFGDEAAIGARELYQAYRAWSEETGEFYTMSARDFSTRLEERGFAHKRTNSGIRWLGLTLAENVSLGLAHHVGYAANHEIEMRVGV